MILKKRKSEKEDLPVKLKPEILNVVVGEHMQA